MYNLFHFLFLTMTATTATTMKNSRPYQPNMAIEITAPVSVKKKS